MPCSVRAVEFAPRGRSAGTLSFVAEWRLHGDPADGDMAHCFWAVMEEPVPSSLLLNAAAVRDLVSGSRPQVSLRYRHKVAALGCEVVSNGAPCGVDVRCDGPAAGCRVVVACFPEGSPPAIASGRVPNLRSGSGPARPPPASAQHRQPPAQQPAAISGVALRTERLTTAAGEALDARLTLSFHWTPPDPQLLGSVVFAVLSGKCAADVREQLSRVTAAALLDPASAPPPARSLMRRFVAFGRRRMPAGSSAEQSIAVQVPPEGQFTVLLAEENAGAASGAVLECSTLAPPPSLRSTRAAPDGDSIAVGLECSHEGVVWYLACGVPEAAGLGLWHCDAADTLKAIREARDSDGADGIVCGRTAVAAGGYHAFSIQRAVAGAGSLVLLVATDLDGQLPSAALRTRQPVRAVVGDSPAAVIGVAALEAVDAADVVFRLKGAAVDACAPLSVHAALLPLPRMPTVQAPPAPVAAAGVAAPDDGRAATVVVQGPGPHPLRIDGLRQQVYGLYMYAVLRDSAAARDGLPPCTCWLALRPRPARPAPLPVRGIIDSWREGRPVPRSAPVKGPRRRKPRRLALAGAVEWVTHAADPRCSAHLNEHLSRDSSAELVPPLLPQKRLPRVHATDGLRPRVMSTGHALDLKQHFRLVATSARPSTSISISCSECCRQQQRVAAVPIAEVPRSGQAFLRFVDRCRAAIATTNLHRQRCSLPPLAPLTPVSMAKWLDRVGAGENNLHDAPWLVTWPVFLIISICDDTDAAQVTRIRQLFDAATCREELRSDEHFSKMLAGIADAIGVSAWHPRGRPRTGFADADMYRGRECDTSEVVLSLLLPRRDAVCLLRARARGTSTDKNFGGRHSCKCKDLFAARKPAPGVLSNVQSELDFSVSVMSPGGTQRPTKGTQERRAPDAERAVTDASAAASEAESAAKVLTGIESHRSLVLTDTDSQGSGVASPLVLSPEHRGSHRGSGSFPSPAAAQVEVGLPSPEEEPDVSVAYPTSARGSIGAMSRHSYNFVLAPDRAPRRSVAEKPPALGFIPLGQTVPLGHARSGQLSPPVDARRRRSLGHRPATAQGEPVRRRASSPARRPVSTRRASADSRRTSTESLSSPRRAEDSGPPKLSDFGDPVATPKSASPFTSNVGSFRGASGQPTSPPGGSFNKKGSGRRVVWSPVAGDRSASQQLSPHLAPAFGAVTLE